MPVSNSSARAAAPRNISGEQYNMCSRPTHDLTRPPAALRWVSSRRRLDSSDSK